jgi:hypothetical protein
VTSTGTFGNHRYRIDGDEVLGVTRVLDLALAKPALTGWAAGVTADYAIDAWDELAACAISERSKRLRAAHQEARSRAATRGTDVHDLATRLAVGEEITTSDETRGLIDAYLAFAAVWQPRELLLEQPVFNRSRGYAGRLDLVAELADARTWLLDFKTGVRGPFPEAALQSAAYRNAEFYLDEAGAEQPLPEVDAAGVVWLRDDATYDLIPVDASPQTFRIFLFALELARWSKSSADALATSDAALGEALAAPRVAA